MASLYVDNKNSNIDKFIKNLENEKNQAQLSLSIYVIGEFGKINDMSSY